MKRLFASIILVTLFILVLSITVVGIKKKSDDSTLKPFNIKAENAINYEKIKKDFKIKVYMTKEDKIEEMDIEDYVKGVVCGEMPAEFEKEALKAQAVAVRTYALAHIEKLGGNKCSKAKGADICDSVHCQVYMAKDERMSSWSKKSRDDYWMKITEAVKETEGEVLIYKDKLVMEPYYFATSSGRTENSVEMFAVDQPYLKSVESKGEEVAPKYKTSIKLSYGEFNNKLNKKYSNIKVNNINAKNQIKIISRTEGGSVKELKVGDTTMTGSEFRMLIKLNSSNFSFKYNRKDIEITCMGYGHGVGMSQWGANSMAKTEKTYTDILSHYYEGVKIKKIY